MTTVLSEKGQIVLPSAIRKRLQLKTGEDFEVENKGDHMIILRRISRPANQGLVDLLTSCPFPFEVPPREKDDTAPLSL
ncbi:MAG: transcriptional regulator/antitoxin, MazE [Verrucomicrobia bacterium RIFCSPHIGHO2_12_FULL_41_10]|nr:MAG: transcriptional regulator/antitoxin, MazE [Verrucomicrobia bacterium RIFCSPHIGHO2_12_FULL_41_10]HLB33209.1 AbrB/MazE/SpoVT family DNA-binding domain-containing protein [Chthoniobacterales bacterium]